MIAEKISVLVVEDSPSDYLLVRKMLGSAVHRQMQITQSETLSEALSCLQAPSRPDVVLLDLGLPDSDALETFARLNDAAPELPVVVLTHLDDSDMAVQAVRAGAQDYLTKQDLSAALLERSIIHAIERKHLVRQVQARALAELGERELQSLAALSPGSIVPDTQGEAGDLRTTATEVFEDLVTRYRTVIEQQIAAGNPKSNPARSRTLYELAERIGLFRAGPGTVIDVHLASIGALEGWQSGSVGTRQAEVSRLMVLEFMGCLAAYYRDFIQSGGRQDGRGDGASSLDGP